MANGNHITQKELAEKIGVSASQLSRIVSGETRTVSRAIPKLVLLHEFKLWPHMPDTAVNTVDRIGRWYLERVAWLKDTYFSDEDRISRLEAQLKNLQNINVAGK